MLPSSLRIFQHENGGENPWHDGIPGPDLLAGGKDIFALNLRHISSHLQELKLSSVNLPRDFLCPLDEYGKPAMPPIKWPYLKLLIYRGSDFLPSGK